MDLLVGAAYEPDQRDLGIDSCDTFEREFKCTDIGEIGSSSRDVCRDIVEVEGCLTDCGTAKRFGDDGREF